MKKQFLAIYGKYGNGATGSSDHTYKLVSAPEKSTRDQVEQALEDTSDGEYTSLVDVLDLDTLDDLTQITLAEMVTLVIVESGE